ncbi:helix-turn-helix transcriptional regulator [Desulfofundulus sp. TPOSR]|nr:helix-turn-helix transcriptional regulator [Desulfofundulus sp. TPOSR]NHM28887.1 helix-turn-helix transcriptional regulator [Desulfofundulus sp. TPOSR]
MDVLLKHQLRYLRNKKGLSQKELAVLTGLHQSQVSKIESGNRKVTAEELQKLAAALGVTVAELLDEQQAKAAGE